MRTTFTTLLILFGITLVAQPQNIIITASNNPNEPSIVMDPKNPAVILAAVNIDGYYRSTDTGRTWTAIPVTSTHGVWGDPVLAVDTNSNFYFFHLSNPMPPGNWIDRIVCQKTTDTGLTWSDGSYMGLNGTKAQDKQWAAVNRKNNHIFVTWTQFDAYGSTDPQDSSVILFSKSTDQGLTWSPAKRINKKAGDCIDSDETVEGAVPAIGPNGEVYVAWAGPDGIYFDRSLDEGQTWLANDIHVDSMPTGWDYDIPGISRANGLPITTCDLSGGPNHGTIYINWSDQRNGSTDTDVWLSKSTDGGNTWSPPSRVNNDPPGRHQFFTWMAVDQVTGILWFVFYDRRNTTGDYTDVYMARSADGGNTFTNFKISQKSFEPLDPIFFGDYTNLAVHNNIVRPIWTRLDAVALSVHTALIDGTNYIGLNEIDYSLLEKVETYPNPAKHKTYVSFKLHEKTEVTISIYDSYGRAMATPLKGQMDYGKHIIPIPLDTYPAGIYFYNLEAGAHSKSGKFVVE